MDLMMPSSEAMANVFITGGTGYIGQRLIPELPPEGERIIEASELRRL